MITERKCECKTNGVVIILFILALKKFHDRREGEKKKVESDTDGTRTHSLCQVLFHSEKPESNALPLGHGALVFQGQEQFGRSPFVRRLW